MNTLLIQSKRSARGETHASVRFLSKLALALACGGFLVGTTGASTAQADVEGVNIARAEGENLAEAIGHYSRSRALLLAALREFDKGLKLANPQILVDVKEFRNTILDRAEDLEKVIAPQPKATRKGVQFSPDSRLMSDNFRPK